MKITTTKEKLNGKDITIFYANDVKVAEMNVFKEYFCTVKNGVRSNLRDKYKTAREITWSREGLLTVTGLTEVSVGFGNSYFKNQKPDYMWGIVPKAISTNSVKEKIEAYIEENKK